MGNHFCLPHPRHIEIFSFFGHSSIDVVRVGCNCLEPFDYGVVISLQRKSSLQHDATSFRNMMPPVSEIIGSPICLWGIASLYTLNHHLPDGGAKTWKKTSALCLLIGIGIVFSAPSIPEWIVVDNELGVSSPYAPISSLGSQLASQSRSRTGGWGIFVCVASNATRRNRSNCL